VIRADGSDILTSKEEYHADEDDLRAREEMENDGPK